MTKQNGPPSLPSRREFLARASTAAGTTVALVGSAGADETPKPEKSLLPTMQLGRHRISRIVAGYNPIGGYSYMGHHMNQHMREYFTVEKTVEFLTRCLKAGITTQQYSPSEKMTDVLQTVAERDLGINFICLHGNKSEINNLSKNPKVIASAHHGGATDRLFKEGKSAAVHDFVKEAHDKGLLAGVSAHNPDCIKRIADEGWEVDFFMGCFYFLTCNTYGSDSQKRIPETLQIDYPFFKDNPDTMTAVLRQVKQPCFGFKILGAGRLCSNETKVKKAFQYAFENLKPTDGVIVGMYPRFFDEIAVNAEYVRQFGDKTA